MLQNDEDIHLESDVLALCNNIEEKITAITATASRDKSENKRASESRGWTALLLLAATTCCLGCAVPMGFNIGAINTSANLMKSFCNESISRNHGPITIEWLNILWSSILSIFLIGGVSGSLTASLIADRLGRKGALSVGNVFGIIGAGLFVSIPFLDSVVPFLLGRLFVGISGGLATSLSPMYMAELAPVNLRGTIGVLSQLGITFGVLLGQIAGLDFVMGTKELWPYMLACFVPLSMMALVTTVVLPESPKFLYIIKGNRQLAMKELSRLRNTDIALLQNEVQTLEEEATFLSQTDKYSFTRVLRDPTLRLPLILVCLLQGGQQLSGVNSIFFYSKSIFEGAGLGGKVSDYATLGTGVANFVMAVVSGILLTYCKRRTLFLNSCIWSIVCLVVLCFSIVWKENPIMPYISIVAVLVYVVVYGIGLGPIPFFIGSDLFDVGPRPVAMALGSVCNWGGNFTVVMTFLLVEQLMGPYSFLVYCCCILFTAVFSWRYLPETQGTNPSEVRSLLAHGLNSRRDQV